MDVIIPPAGSTADFLRGFLAAVDTATEETGDAEQAADIVIARLFDR